MAVTFRCLEEAHTFTLELAEDCALHQTQTAFCRTHGSSAVAA